MKNKLLFFLPIILIGIQLSGQDAKQAIGQMIDDWHLAAAEADYDGYFSRMTNDAVFIGTDATENWQLMEFKEFSKPYFDRGKAWSFKAAERNIYLDEDGKLAWFDELLDTWMGICRGSGVAKLENEQWKILHYVLSATIPNDDMQQVIGIKKEKDSLQLLKLAKQMDALKKD